MQSQPAPKPALLLIGLQRSKASPLPRPAAQPPPSNVAGSGAHSVASLLASYAPSGSAHGTDRLRHNQSRCECMAQIVESKVQHSGHFQRSVPVPIQVHQKTTSWRPEHPSTFRTASTFAGLRLAHQLRCESVISVSILAFCIGPRPLKKLQAARHNLSPPLLAVVRACALPFARAQPTLNKNLPTFLEILLAPRRELSRDDNPMPFRSFQSLTRAVQLRFLRGNRKAHHGQAIRSATDFRVLPQVPNNHDLAVRRHDSPLSCSLPGIGFRRRFCLYRRAVMPCGAARRFPAFKKLGPSSPRWCVPNGAYRPPTSFFGSANDASSLHSSQRYIISHFAHSVIIYLCNYTSLSERPLQSTPPRPRHRSSPRAQ
jgi:hypothetical protein